VKRTSLFSSTDDAYEKILSDSTVLSVYF